MGRLNENRCASDLLPYTIPCGMVVRIKIPRPRLETFHLSTHAVDVQVFGPLMKSSNICLADSSGYCSGGDFIK